MPHLKHICPTSHEVSRGIAAFLAGFTLLNLLGETAARHFSGNCWWIDLRPLPVPLARALLLVGAILLLAFALRPIACLWRRRCTAGAVGLLGVFAAWNATGFFALLAFGRIHSYFPLPLSLFILAGLILICRSVFRAESAPNGKPMGRWFPVATVALACCIGFPLAQMLCFGGTDYRRRADAIVVFGARTYADGSVRPFARSRALRRARASPVP